MKELLKLILILVLMGVICVLPMWLMPRAGASVTLPHIQLPAEPLTSEPLFYLAGQPYYLTNTMVATLLADIVLIVMAVVAGGAARRRMRAWEANPKQVDTEGDDLMTPKRWHNTFEAIIEYLYGLVEQTVGDKRAMQVFPLVGTIFLFLLIANWMHFVPIVDSLGIVHCAEAENGVKGFEAVRLGNSDIYILGLAGGKISRQGELAEVGCPAHGHEAEGEHAEGEEAIDESKLRFVITPYMRTAATDLNLTIGMALVAVTAVQVFGVRELGLMYFSKFINLPALKKGFMGYIQLAVGGLEIISEVSRLLSFGMRLFGNIFAGAILLFVMAFLIPIGLPVVFYFLEIFVGLIQALVFAMLTLVFIAVAMAGHGDEHH